MNIIHKKGLALIAIWTAVILVAAISTTVTFAKDYSSTGIMSEGEAELARMYQPLESVNCTFACFCDVLNFIGFGRCPGEGWFNHAPAPRPEPVPEPEVNEKQPERLR